MQRGHGIPWVLLIVGAPLALFLLATMLILVLPLVYASATGGNSYQIRSDAMSPALLPGDWVLAEALAPGAQPERGDIVAYEHPVMRRETLIRRVVGLPGDRVQMRGGALYIDGQRVEMTQLDDRIIPKVKAGRDPEMTVPACVNDTDRVPVAPGGACHQEQWRETWPDGRTIVVLNTKGKVGLAQPGGGPGFDDTRSTFVPQGFVFVVGDNRDSSIDSRIEQHGLVPIANIRSHIWLIHTSLDRSSRFLRPRFGRFFLRVQ